MSCHSTFCTLLLYFLLYRDLDGGGPQVNEHRNITHHEVIPSEPSDIGQATLVTTSTGIVTNTISFLLLFHIKMNSFLVLVQVIVENKSQLT